MVYMVIEAEQAGASIITANEVSKEQFEAVLRMPGGWAGHYEINDRLRNGGWGGNAVFWKTSKWDLEKAYGRPHEIDYRRGLKYGPKGPYYKRFLTQACVQLRHKKHVGLLVDIQAFHYPTEYSSNEASRNSCVRKTSNWAAVRIANGHEVVTGGDGNGLEPDTKGLYLAGREGPDRLKTTGKVIRKVVLQFKKKKKSDHNGIFALVRFTEKPSRN